MKQRVNESLLHFLQVTDISLLTGDDLPENLLSGPFAGTEVTNKVFLGALAPRGNRKDTGAGYGHLGERGLRT